MDTLGIRYRLLCGNIKRCGVSPGIRLIRIIIRLRLLRLSLQVRETSVVRVLAPPRLGRDILPIRPTLVEAVVEGIILLEEEKVVIERLKNYRRRGHTRCIIICARPMIRR